MLVAGYNPNSFVDYPGHIAAVIFFGGCNFDCWYCHNRWLLNHKDGAPLKEILARIEKRKNFIDAVVLSGGEATLQGADALLSLMGQIQAMGLKVKLDTNGSNPAVLKTLLPHLDYVAMDIKAPVEKYGLVCETDENGIRNIKKSIKLLKSFGGEFRTTVTGEFTVADIVSIAKEIAGGKAVYYLQQINPPAGQEGLRATAPAPDTLRAMQAAANHYLPTRTRGV